MQTTQRKHEPGVVAQLLDEPHRFQFAQLLNILLDVLRRQGVPYEKAFGEVLRFQNSLSVAFPASEVQAVDVEPAAPLDKHETVRAMRSGGVRKVRITPSFIGLLGTGGTLPLHDTERIAAQQLHDGDASQRELLDVFSNRMIGLFYEAWGKYRIEHGMDTRGRDRLLPLLTALAGLKTAVRGDPNRLAQVRDETAAYYAGLLRTRPVSAATIERVLTDYLGVPVRLAQFVGSWDEIPENRRSTLGVTAPKLGLGAPLGVRQWRHDLRAQLRVGPLEEAQVNDFLPGGSALRALEEMVRQFAVPSLKYEVRLLLAPAYIKRMTLATKGLPKRLGWSTFLTSTPGVVREPEIGLMLRLSPHEPA